MSSAAARTSIEIVALPMSPWHAAHGSAGHKENQHFGGQDTHTAMTKLKCTCEVAKIVEFESVILSIKRITIHVKIIIHQVKPKDHHCTQEGDTNFAAYTICGFTMSRYHAY